MDASYLANLKRGLERSVCVRNLVKSAGEAHSMLLVRREPIDAECVRKENIIPGNCNATPMVHSTMSTQMKKVYIVNTML